MKNKNFQKFSDHSEFFFCFSIHKKLNKSCSLDKIFLFLKKKIVSLKKTSFEILWSEVWNVGFQLMLILGILCRYFNASVVFVKNTFLLFKLALAILWIISKSIFLSILKTIDKTSRKVLPYFTPACKAWWLRNLQFWSFDHQTNI